MDIGLSDIVESRNGRDAGKHFFVVGDEGEYLLLADGKGRKLEKPKRKKRRHVCFTSGSDSRVAEKIRQNERVTNSEIRRALAEHFGEGYGEKEVC